MQKTLLLLIFLGINTLISAQEYTAYGVKGGMTCGFQKWNSNQTDDVLFLPLGNGTIFTEMYAGGRGSLCIELGYHERGSSIIQRGGTYRNANGIDVNFPTVVLQRKFSNIVFQPAFKQIYDVGSGWSGYYMLGVRAEYTIKDTIPYVYNQVIPVNLGLNRFNYGITIGGGFERRLGSSPMMMQVEMQAQPDFSLQIQSPAFSYYDVVQRTNATFNEQKVSNITLELTVGFKFAEFPEEE